MKYKSKARWLRNKILILCVGFAVPRKVMYMYCILNPLSRLEKRDIVKFWIVSVLTKLEVLPGS